MPSVGCLKQTKRVYFHPLVALHLSPPLHRRLITRWTSTSLTETLRCSLRGAAKCAGSKTASSTSFASSQGCSSLASIFSSASHSELDTSTDVSQRICVLDALGISSSASATPEPWGVMGLLTEEWYCFELYCFEGYCLEPKYCDGWRMR